MISPKYFLAGLGIIILSYFYNKSPATTTEEINWGPIIQTGSGSVRGIVTKSRDGREYHQWLGIPYAKPPIGSLRFSSPRPVDKWEGVRDGSKYGEQCAQLKLWDGAFSGSEDCLFLNVHAPKLNEKHLLPVIVFVHGGSYFAGSGSDFDPTYVMDEDIIVITLNYRLGILGFITTGDENIRGNMGLKDVVVALKWIQKNVQHFGGDPHKVTLMGHSAGSSAVHHLFLAPSTKGLFSKVISMGGTALLPWSFSKLPKAIEKTKKLADQLNCPMNDNAKLTECLRGLKVQELLHNHGNETNELALFSPTKGTSGFVPTVEPIRDSETLLAEHPYDVIREGKAHNIPWLTGVVRDEGLLSTFEFYRDPSTIAYLEENWEDCLPRSFPFSSTFSPTESTEIIRKIREFYFPPNSPKLTEDETVDRLTEMYSDGSFIVGASVSATSQRAFSPVYLYYYSRTGGPNYGSVLAKSEKSTNPDREYGICHAEEGLLMYPYWSYMYIPKDDQTPLYKFSKDFVKLFVQFAYDETSMEFRGVKFTPTKESGPLTYLQLNEEPGMIPEPFSKRTAFWNSINYSQMYSSAKNNH